MDRVEILAKRLIKYNITMFDDSELMFNDKVKNEDYVLSAQNLFYNFIITSEHLSSLPDAVFNDLLNASQAYPNAYSMETLYENIIAKLLEFKN